MKNKADRFNEGKPQWSLVDFKSLEPMVRVLEFGAEKYDRHNWKKGLTTSSICESLLRHVFALMNGQETDPESGLPHVGHIQCNAMFLAYMKANRSDFDDLQKSPSFLYERPEPPRHPKDPGRLG